MFFMSHVAKSASFACDINKFSAGVVGLLTSRPIALLQQHPPVYSINRVVAVRANKLYPSNQNHQSNAFIIKVTCKAAHSDTASHICPFI